MGSSRISRSDVADQQRGQRDPAPLAAGHRADRLRPGRGAACRGRRGWPGRRRRRPTRARRRSRSASQAVPSTTSRTVAVGGEVERLRQREHPQVAAVGDPAGVGLLGLGEQPQQGGLAGAVEADHADPVGVVEAERDVGEQRPGGAVPLAHPVQVDDVGHAQIGSVRPPGRPSDRARARGRAARTGTTPARPSQRLRRRASSACAGVARRGRRRSGRSRRRCRRARRRPSPAFERRRPAPGAATARRPAGRCRAPRRAPRVALAQRGEQRVGAAQRRAGGCRRRAAGPARGRRRGWTGRRRRWPPPSARWWPRASTGLTASPRPVPSAVPPWTRNGTSEPRSAAMPASSSRDSPVPQSASQATSAAAASALPPASPPASGICLRRCSRACGGHPGVRRRAPGPPG